MPIASSGRSVSAGGWSGCCAAEPRRGRGLAGGGPGDRAEPGAGVPRADLAGAPDRGDGGRRAGASPGSPSCPARPTRPSSPCPRRPARRWSPSWPRAGCGGAVVYSSGFAETGPAGADRQRALVAAAGDDAAARAELLRADQLRGPGADLAGPARRGGAGRRASAGWPWSPSRRRSRSARPWSTPGCRSATCSPWATAPRSGRPGPPRRCWPRDRVSAVGLILETLADVRGLERLAARARDRRIGLVALVLGRSEPARRAVLTHTGSLAGPAAVGVELPAPHRDRRGRARSTRCSPRWACCTAAAR